MGIRKEVVEPLVRGGAEREDFDHPEGLHEAALLTVFFQNLQTFMVECGVSDFTFNDCLKPESDRLRFVLSSVINYVRFRAEKDPIIREYFEKAEKKRDQIEQLFTENEELKKKVLELRKRRQQEEPALQEAVNINSSLMNDLRNLRKRQAEMEEEQEKLKAEKEKLKKQLVSKLSKRCAWS